MYYLRDGQQTNEHLFILLILITIGLFFPHQMFEMYFSKFSLNAPFIETMDQLLLIRKKHELNVKSKLYSVGGKVDFNSC